MPGNAAKNQNAAKKGKSGMPRISVIILNWNGRKIIGNCLKSVFQQAVPPHEVIVVDNGSTDGSQEFVKTRFRQARLVELKANKGKPVKSLEVADLDSKKLIDAEKAFWVIGGDKKGVMTKTPKWAFARKSAAEAFIKKSGGRLATYKEALALAEKD